MWYFAYTLLLTVAAPFGALWLFVSSRHRRLLRRFHPPIPQSFDRPIWVHACSVGEVRTAAPILKAIHTEWPDFAIVLSVSTIAGRNLADTANTVADHITWLPFDHPWMVRSFVRRLKPRALIITETELWPALLHETAKTRRPIAVVNGRLSGKHFTRYQRFARLLRPFVACLSVVGVQNDTYKKRFAALGVPEDRMTVTGSTKFDGAPERSALDGLRELETICGCSSANRVLVFGSTRPGDEDRAAACWQTLREEFPDLRLIIAPRHPERLSDALQPFREPILKRSTLLNGGAYSGERIIAVDTLGELAHFYAMATVAVIGGSFSEDVQGHNPLEPAALGVPTVFGPQMGNFPEAASALCEAGGAIQLANSGDLLPTLQDLLANDTRRAEIGRAAQRIVEGNKGAIATTISVLRPLINRE